MTAYNDFSKNYYSVRAKSSFGQHENFYRDFRDAYYQMKVHKDLHHKNIELIEYSAISDRKTGRRWYVTRGGRIKSPSVTKYVTENGELI